MNWNIFSKPSGSVKRRVPSPRAGCRLNLEALEDRTVLSTVDFLEVQGLSPLALSGTIGGVDIQPQGLHALSTTYFGDFRADINEVNGTIRFLGAGNDFCAADTGNWAPLADGSSGTASAIYGLQADLGGMPFLAALRDFHTRADTVGSGLALYQNPDGSFGFSSAQTITINAGSGTYSHPTLGHGPLNLSGLHGQNQAGDGTFVDTGSSLRLTVPIDVTVNTTIAGQPATLRLQGTMVGTATVPAVKLNAPGASGNDFATRAIGGGPAVNLTDPAAAITSGTALHSATITLTNHPDGGNEALAVNLGSSGLTSSGYNPSTGQLTLTGTASAAVYQNVLRTVTYQDSATNPNTADRVVTFVVSDGTSTSLERRTTVSVAPSPIVITLPGDQVLTTNTLVLSSATGNAISIADPALTTLPALVTITADHGATFSLSGVSGLTFSTGTGTNDSAAVFTGALADVNAALDGLTYTAADGFTGSATLTVTASDQQLGGTGPAQTDTQTLTLTAAPIAITLPGAQTTSPNTPLVLSSAAGTAISVADAGATTNLITVTLIVSDGATLTLAGTSGLTFLTGTGTGDTVVSFTGLLADVNAALDGLTYTPGANFTGSSTLQVQVSDQALGGRGGAQMDSQTLFIQI
jgi:hypothetical protein